MAGFRRSRSISTGVRHRSSWEAGPETSGGGAPQNISGSSVQLAGTAVQATVDSLTLIRTRGEFMAFLTAASAVGDGFHGAFGIAKVTAAAFTAGVASIPTPITEEAWDGWLYHRYFSLFSGGILATAAAAEKQLQVNNVTAALRLEVDSKAMRKQDVDEAFVAVIEVAVHGTAAMEWAFNCRLLTKDMG